MSLASEQRMTENVLAHIDAAATRDDSRSFYLSEFLTDAARIHQETAQFDRLLYRDAVCEVRRLRVASVNFLRRHLKLEYAQAVYFIYRMEREGVIQRTDHRGRDSRHGWRYEVIGQP
jgi:hypothetical protein